VVLGGRDEEDVAFDEGEAGVFDEEPEPFMMM